MNEGMSLWGEWLDPSVALVGCVVVVVVIPEGFVEGDNEGKSLAASKVGFLWLFAMGAKEGGGTNKDGVMEGANDGTSLLLICGPRPNVTLTT